MENENENLNSTNETDVNESEKVVESDELAALKAKVVETEEKNKQLFERAKKAEGEAKELRGKSEAKPEKSEKFDYGQLAYLKTSGIQADEYEFVEEEMERSKMPLHELVENEYFQQKLKSQRESMGVLNATPTSKRPKTQAADLVEYHIAKKTPLEEIKDTDLKRAIVNKRLERSKKESKFTDNPVVM